MGGCQPARVPAGAHQDVVAPDTARFTLQKIDELHFTRGEECHKELAHAADCPTSKTIRSAEAFLIGDISLSEPPAPYGSPPVAADLSCAPELHYGPGRPGPDRTRSSTAGNTNRIIFAPQEERAVVIRRRSPAQAETGYIRPHAGRLQQPYADDDNHHDVQDRLDAGGHGDCSG